MIGYVKCILDKAFICSLCFGATLWRVGARLSREWLAMYSVYLNKAFIYIVCVLVQHCDELALVSAENDWLCTCIFKQGLLYSLCFGATLWRVGARLSREWLTTVYIFKQGLYIVYVLVQHCDELALVSAENDWLCTSVYLDKAFICSLCFGATLWRVGARLSREWLAMYSVYILTRPLYSLCFGATLWRVGARLSREWLAMSQCIFKQGL